MGRRARACRKSKGETSIAERLDGPQFPLRPYRECHSVRNPIQEVTSTRLPEGCREWHRAYSSLNPQKGKSSMYSPTLPGLFSLLATSHSVLLRSCVLRASSRFQLG